MKPKSGASDSSCGSAAVEGSPLVEPAQRLRLLVIDDEPVVARFVERVFACDCDVTVLSCGDAAIAFLSQEAARVDLILCDLMMPGATGADVYAEVMHVRPDLTRRFLLMTGGAFTRRTADFLAHVRPPVLEKPFDTKQLRAAILGLLTSD